MDLICSDLHANLPAFKRLRRFIDVVKPAKIFILGDLVGYGANPNEVVQEVQRLQGDYQTHVIHGNHDYIVMDPLIQFHFNDFAKQAILWTLNELTPENKQYIQRLPSSLVDENVDYVHGSPTGNDDYILDNYDAMQAFKAMTSELGFFGHTHLPGIISRKLGRIRRYYEAGKWITLDDWTHLVNPGSVGQPRNKDPRASFCLHDPDLHRVRFVRLAYDVGAAQKAILDTKGKIPSWQAERLAGGR